MLCRRDIALNRIDNARAPNSSVLSDNSIPRAAGNFSPLKHEHGRDNPFTKNPKEPGAFFSDPSEAPTHLPNHSCSANFPSFIF